jgi:hypothetical protein
MSVKRNVTVPVGSSGMGGILVSAWWVWVNYSEAVNQAEEPPGTG